MARVRIAFALLAALFVLTPRAAFAQWNGNFSLSLHATLGDTISCQDALAITCWCGTPSTVTVPPSTEITVYVLVLGFLCIEPWLTGVQTAFEWAPGWRLLDSSWECQDNQLVAAVPQEPGGPTAGTITTAFDCATGHNVEVIGRMKFLSGPSGCLRQVQTTYPFGIHVFNCDNDIEQIDPDDWRDWVRLGRVCVDQGGLEGCWDPGAVERATWGFIKALYR